MDQHKLDLQGLFEDHGICSYTITNSLDFRRVVYEQCALVQPPATALQLTNLQRGVQFSTRFPQSPAHFQPKDS